MAIERLWVGVPTQLFTADGGKDGEVSIPSTVGLKVKQKVLISSNTQSPQVFEIKRVLNNTDIIVGPIGPEMKKYADLRLYLTSANSFLRVDEQERPKIIPDAFWRSVFEEEPTVALRTFLVDYLGNRYTDNNPLPVAGTLTVDTTEILSQKIINSDMPNANQDYTITLPTGVRKFRMQVRGSIGTLKVYESSGGAYFTLPRGSYYEIDNIKTTSTVLIVQSSAPASVLEFYCWIKNP